MMLASSPTLTQAVDAQAWQALGLDETGPLTLGKLRRALLERTLKTSLRAKAMDTADTGKWLATNAVGTPTREVATIQRALVSRWLFEGDGAKDGEPERASSRSESPGHVEPKRVLPARNVPKEVLPARKEASPTSTPTPRGSKQRRSKHRRSQQSGSKQIELTPIRSKPTKSKSSARSRRARSNEPPTLERWAEMIHSLVEGMTSGFYGEERVFISAVWRVAQQGHRSLRGSLSEFKARLIEANRAGLLCLHRADLVGAMDEQLVRESETRHLNATFHFIETPARRTS